MLKTAPAVPEKYEKLIVSLRTAQAKEYSLDKEQTSYKIRDYFYILHHWVITHLQCLRRFHLLEI